MTPKKKKSAIAHYFAYMSRHFGILTIGSILTIYPVFSDPLLPISWGHSRDLWNDM